MQYGVRNSDARHRVGVDVGLDGGNFMYHDIGFYVAYIRIILYYLMQLSYI